MNNILLVFVVALIICYFTRSREHFTEMHTMKIQGTQRDCSKESIDSAFYNYNTNAINKTIRPD